MHENMKRELEEVFQQNPKPSKETIESLRKKYRYSYTTIYRWFWERRSKKQNFFTMAGRRQRARRNKPLHCKCHSVVSSSPSARSNSERKNALKQEPINDITSTSGDASLPTNTAYMSMKHNKRSVPAYAVQQPSFQELDPPQETMFHLSSPEYSMPKKIQEQSIKSVHSASPEATIAQRSLCSNVVFRDVFAGPTPSQIQVLEGIFACTNTPSQEIIQRLASRFVHEQDMEDKITEWFHKRRSGLGSVNAQPVLAGQPKILITDIQHGYQTENDIEEIHFEVCADSQVRTDTPE